MSQEEPEMVSRKQEVGQEEQYMFSKLLEVSQEEPEMVSRKQEVGREEQYMFSK